MIQCRIDDDTAFQRTQWSNRRVWYMSKKKISIEIPFHTEVGENHGISKSQIFSWTKIQKDNM